jgi:subtilisin family serine protease
MNGSRRSLCRATAASALALVGLALGAPGAVGAQTTKPQLYRDDAVLVGFKPGVPAKRQKAIAGTGAMRSRRLAPTIRIVHVHRGHVHRAVRMLRHRQGVRYAEPDYLMREAAAPNDPSFRLQWGLANTGQVVNGNPGTPGADERALPAWTVTTGDPSVVIGETDSGIDYRHPDLAGNVWSNPGGIGGCVAGTHGYNVVAGTCDPMDDDTRFGGHGTHVAGIMGAVGNNGIGVTGVNWTTSILPVKFLNSSGSGPTSRLISALDWLVQAKQAGVNLRVVNDSATFVGTPYSQALSDEIDQLGANDILFVTAAGNTADNNDDPSVRRYPCGYGRPNEICVAASDQKDRLPSWANYGPNTVDLAAPGNNIYSTLRNGTYGYIRGSSMASAEVSGAAALILSNGYRSATALKADILNSVDRLPSLSGLVRTGGRLDICRALPSCFGKTTVGGTGESLPANRKRVNRYSLTQTGTVRKLSLYLQPTPTAGSQTIKGVIYSDLNGAPGALLETTNKLVFHSTDAKGWYDLKLSTPVTLLPGKYWIGFLAGGTSKVAATRWDSGKSNRVTNTNSYKSGPSNPFGTSTSTDQRQMSLYAVFTPLA